MEARVNRVLSFILFSVGLNSLCLSEKLLLLAPARPIIIIYAHVALCTSVLTAHVHACSMCRGFALSDALSGVILESMK